MVFQQLIGEQEFFSGCVTILSPLLRAGNLDEMYINSSFSSHLAHPHQTPPPPPPQPLPFPPRSCPSRVVGLTIGRRSMKTNIEMTNGSEGLRLSTEIGTNQTHNLRPSLQSPVCLKAMPNTSAFALWKECPYRLRHRGGGGEFIDSFTQCCSCHK